MNLDRGSRVIIKGLPEHVFQVLPVLHPGYVDLQAEDGHQILSFPIDLLEAAPHGVKPGQVYVSDIGTRVFVTHETEQQIFFCAPGLATHQAAGIDNFLNEYELELDV